MTARLHQAVIVDGNVFEVLMGAGRVCPLGQITNALFEVVGLTFAQGNAPVFERSRATAQALAAGSLDSRHVQVRQEASEQRDEPHDRGEGQQADAIDPDEFSFCFLDPCIRHSNGFMQTGFSSST